MVEAGVGWGLVLASPPPLETKLGVEPSQGTTPGDSQSLAPKPLPPAFQVLPGSRPLPDTVDAHGPSCASWLYPLSLALVRSSLLACPQGPDVYLCTLKSAPPGTAPQGLREDASSTSKPRARGCTLVEAGGGKHC